MAANEALAVTFAVTRVLDALGIPHLVGGSLASSLHGIPRLTQDSDVVAAIPLDKADRLVELLTKDFYVDTEAVKQAIRNKKAFNAIHLTEHFKVDIFVPKDEAYSRTELDRGIEVEIDGMKLVVASPEDIVLQKLVWYRKGREVSERQWSDVLGVLRVNQDDLDWSYIDTWAEYLKIADLVDKARVEATR